MPKLRNRIVTFRVTNEEFEKLQSACDRRGARCMSDFARQLMLSDPNLDPEGVMTKVAALHERVVALEVSMLRLSDALTGNITASAK